MANKPKKYNYKEADGSFDYESYEEDLDRWADLQEDEAMERHMEDSYDREQDDAFEEKEG